MNNKSLHGKNLTVGFWTIISGESSGSGNSDDSGECGGSGDSAAQSRDFGDSDAAGDSGDSGQSRSLFRFNKIGPKFTQHLLSKLDWLLFTQFLLFWFSFPMLRIISKKIMTFDHS